METRGRAREASRLRDMLSALKDRVVTLEDFIGDVKERLDEVDGGLTDGLQSMKEQLRDYVWEFLSSIENKLTGRDDTPEAMMTALKEEIVELKSELTIYMAVVGNRGLVVAPKPNVDVPKPKEFNGTRPVKDVDNFLWGME
ncbi:calcium-transporting ATPase 12, plasma membrane-type-like [Gossypium australe]|uniref:Calcium-transporting ATPase 12, plasma membrane-type-like n=1 Tax=Gossypium australe TaxID=47621 RepID=A0A5B6U3K1_9ROSI|nr:calcium-transporting ATPase 12, plasma membrane-type-like [Gossypium australe]